MGRPLGWFGLQSYANDALAHTHTHTNQAVACTRDFLLLVAATLHFELAKIAVKLK